MISELGPDQAVIRAAVGSNVFVRGRDYAVSGAVRDLQRSDAGRVLIGRVLGTARQPYVATVLLERDRDGTITDFAGRCTCPIGIDCKHTVAVVLAAQVPTHSRDIASTPWTNWEATLEALTLRTGVEDPPAAHVALQFDVVITLGAITSVVLRPVVPGRTGWVRTGISWSTLSSLRYSSHAGAADHVRLLDELVTLYAGTRSALQYSYSYGYREQRITLETFVSRRLWDLFDEMTAAGIPFVGSGRSPMPVIVHRGSATVGFDLTRSAEGITIAPNLLLDGASHAVPSGLPLGDPAHGLAWTGNGALNLTRLTGSKVADLSAMLAAPAVTVPEADQSRLLDAYVPRLQRLVPMISSDQSVTLPAPRPPVLALHVEHRDGHHVALAWDWIYSDGAQQRREPMWPAAGRDEPGRDPAAEREIAAPVIEAAQGMPRLFEDGRLAPNRELAGLATATFVGEILPVLSVLTDLQVTSDGDPADYREAHDTPVITFAGEAEGRDWFDLEVSVSVAGQHVPFLSLFHALARGDDVLILPSGTYFALDRPEFTHLARLIEESRALLDAPPGTVRVGRLQADVWDELERLGVVDTQADAWRGATRALSTVQSIAEAPVPSGLHAQLRSYQLDGFTWLAFLFEHGLGGVLADEMGLGKTLQVLALMCHVREKGLNDAPFLVIAPTSVVHNWVTEAARFAPGLTVRTITETSRRRRHEVSDVAAGADVIITSYTLFRLEHDQYDAVTWAGLVLDEAQFVKNHRSLAYECAKTLDAQFKLAVTGTPLENNLMELWSLLSITAPGLFPRPGSFEQYYRWPVERERDADRLDQLRRRVRPIMLRRTKTQVLADLPDKQEQILELDLNVRHRKIYQTHLQRERQKVLGLLGDLESNRFAIFRSLTLLRQACLDPALVDPAHATIPATKLDALLDQLTELAADGHRAVVFSQFTRFLDAARSRLDRAGIAYCYLDGKTKRRAEVIERFKSGDAPVFLVSLRAGGFGLTLTEADYCFLLDPWWNPATEAQAVDRLHRIGQARKVMVYRMVARDTIEEKVMALKAGKAALFDSVMDARGVTSGKLTAADIRGLVS